MRYAVLHMEKAIGSDSGMSAHIERTIAPKNADANRTHLNWEMITFPDGVTNRTEAIQYRLETAGLQRGIEGSEARHVSTSQFYRDLYEQNKELKEDIEHLLEQKQEVYDSVRYLYEQKDEAQNKFLTLHDYTQQKYPTLKPV